MTYIITIMKYDCLTCGSLSLCYISKLFSVWNFRYSILVNLEHGFGVRYDTFLICTFVASTRHNVYFVLRAVVENGHSKQRRADGVTEEL